RGPCSAPGSISPGDGDGCGFVGGGRGLFITPPPRPRPRPRDRLPPGRPTMLDVLIAGGLIIDGSGNPGYHGAIGIEGERVRVFRGALDGVAAHRTVDATSRVVCPGFIDMHAHSG